MQFLIYIRDVSISAAFCTVCCCRYYYCYLLVMALPVDESPLAMDIERIVMEAIWKWT